MGKMITLDQLIQETGINRNTLAKYRALRLIPRPQIVHRGYRKEGEARGNQALYPSYTPSLIARIANLKTAGYSLSQIQDKIGEIISQIEEITPEEEISEPLEPGRLGEAAISVGRRLDELAPRYRSVFVEYERDETDGKLKVEAVWGVQKKV